MDLRHPPTPRSGSTLVLVALLVIALAGIAAALARLTGSGYLENRTTREALRASQLCEAGLNEAWATLRAHDEATLVADFAAPIAYGPHTVDVDVALGSTDPVLAADRVRITANAKDGNTRAASALVLRKEPNGFFRYALFGDTGVVLESNSYIDSYDSNEGPYDADAHGVSADVGSNQDIELHSNLEVYGNVYAGPDGVVDDSAPNSTVYGDVGSADALVELEDIPVPSIPSTRPLTIRGSVTLGPGDFHYRGLTVDGTSTLVIKGPSRFVLDDFVVRSNAQVVIDATNGPVELHCLGDVELRSNSSLRTITPNARSILLNIVTNTRRGEGNVLLNSNSTFQGTINAPDADLTINSNFEVYGGVRAGSIELESNARIHFDEDLLFDAGKEIEYTIVSWSKTTPSSD